MHFLSQLYEKFPLTIFHCLILRNVPLGPEDLKKPPHLRSTNTSPVLCGAGGVEFCVCMYLA